MSADEAAEAALKFLVTVAVSSVLGAFIANAFAKRREQTRSRISDADIVVIMGFGFHQKNMNKIQFAKLATQEGKRVLVTVQALDTEKRDFLKSMKSVTAYEKDCANFMMGFVEEWAKPPPPQPRISGPRLPS